MSVLYVFQVGSPTLGHLSNFQKLSFDTYLCGLDDIKNEKKARTDTNCQREVLLL